MVLTLSGEEESSGLPTVASLLHKATQIVLGSRIQTRDLKVAQRNIEYGIEIQKYVDFELAFWAPMNDLLGVTGNEVSQIFLNIYAENSVGIKTKYLIEKWIFTYRLPQPSEVCRPPSFDCPESVQFLRTILSTTRLLPAFEHSKTLSKLPNQFVLTYQVERKPILTNFNTKDVKHCSFPLLSTGQGTLEASVDYRVSCSEYSKVVALSIEQDVNMSYYPPSQVLNKSNDEQEAKKQEIKSEKVQSLKKEDVPEIKTEEKENCAVEVPEEPIEEDETLFFSCVSDVPTPESVSGLLLSSSIISEEYTESNPISPEIREFQQTISHLQDMEMFKNTSTYTTSDLRSLQRFMEIVESVGK